MPPLHFLVFDQDAERRRSLAESLRAAGHRVFETGEPQVASDWLAGPGIDGLFLGLAPPNLNVELLRAAICPSESPLPVSLEAAERLHIARTLEHTGGNRRQAALTLGISRSTLLHKIRKYGLDDAAERHHQPQENR